MAISVADLKFYQSERMTDYADGGGRMTDNEIVSGVENQIFDDVSDVDRAAGDVSIRKVYAAVTSANTDKYLDAGVVIFKEADDAAASVLAFSTGDFYDERAALQSRLEQTVSRGPRYNGYLYGQHLIGQRALLIWQRPEVPLPSTGERLELIAKAGGVEEYSQFLWITRIFNEIRTQYDSNGAYAIRVVTCELAEALTANYTGLEPSRTDPSIASATAVLHETRYNAEAVPVFGVMPTALEATTGDFTVKVDSLFQSIIPTAFQETALADVTPGGDSAAYIAGNSGAVSFTTTTESIKPNTSLFCGTGITPGTLSIAVSGATITDSGGIAKLGATEIGEVDYGNGVIAWNTACPDYGAASKTVTFKPAAKPVQIPESAAQYVTAENRGFVWIIALSPIPAPGTLRVSYRVSNQWYVLTENGSGQLAGADSSYGSGSISFSTGTVTISTGALPDVDSEIIYAWSTPALYTARGGAAVDAPVVRGQTANLGIAPGTVSVEWTVDATTYTLDDAPANDGNLTGTGGVGAINYATGEWWVRPDALPPGGTDFDITYQWGTPYEETFTAPARAGDSTLELSLSHANILPGTVSVTWTIVAELDGPLNNADMTLTGNAPATFTARDNGSGALVIAGGTNGAVNYVAGTLDFLPDVTVTLMEATYGIEQVGDAFTWTA